MQKDKENKIEKGLVKKLEEVSKELLTSQLCLKKITGYVKAYLKEFKRIEGNVDYEDDTNKAILDILNNIAVIINNYYPLKGIEPFYPQNNGECEIYNIKDFRNE